PIHGATLLPRGPFVKRAGVRPLSVTNTKPTDPFPVSHSILVLPFPRVSVTCSGFAVITGPPETGFELLWYAFCSRPAPTVDTAPEKTARHTTRAAITERAFASTDRLRRFA